jgi:hypothetical protein
MRLGLASITLVPHSGGGEGHILAVLEYSGAEYDCDYHKYSCTVTLPTPSARSWCGFLWRLLQILKWLGIENDQQEVPGAFNSSAIKSYLNNWARQDALLMYYKVIFGRLATVDHDVTTCAISLLNRADAELLKYIQYNVNHCDKTRGENYKLATECGQQLIDNICEVIDKPPVYKDGEILARSVFLI